MSLLVIGLSHKSAPVEIREQLAFAPHELPDVIAAATSQYQFPELVVLSTCNRVEFYVPDREAEAATAGLLQMLAQHRNIDAAEIAPHLYTRQGDQALRHVFLVAAGLDSMVVGETQIRHQVLEAYEMAVLAGGVGRRLGPVFQKALGVAKAVHTRTDIGAGHVSVASVAVDLAEKIFDNLPNTSVLIIGAGETGGLVLQHLKERGVQRTLVTNRTAEKAEALAKELGGKALAFEELASNLHRADIVISTTGAPHFVIAEEMVRSAMKARHNDPMFFLDIAVPRDVHPAANDIDNVYLYDIDHLEQVVAQNREQREKQVEYCLAIVDAEAHKLSAKLRGPDLGDVASDLTEKLQEIKSQELDRLFRKVNGLPDEYQKQIEQMANRIVNKIAHHPLSTLRREARNGRGFQLVEAIRGMFGLRRD